MNTNKKSNILFEDHEYTYKVILALVSNLIIIF